MVKAAYLVTLSLLINFAPLITSSGQSNPPSPKTEQKFFEIKDAAREIAQADSLIVRKIVFGVNAPSKELSYNLTGIDTELLGFEPIDVYALPFEKQVLVETLRKRFTGAVPNETFWRLPLRNAEDFIRLTVLDIESTKDAAELRTKLVERRIQIDQELGRLELSIIEFGKAKGLDVRKGARGIASDTFSVKVATDPAGGRIKVIRFLNYRECSRLNTCGDNWPWRELVSARENMVGEYYYIAEWPGGEKAEGKIDVRNDSDIVIKPARR